MSVRAPCWARRFSPQATFGQVPVTAVRDALRQQFRRRGRPRTLRVDNGTPWGNWNDLPTPFALWVLGLDVGWHWNDPCCPQQNPKIERSQGTGKRWGEPGLCRSVVEVQANLDEADRIQREEYPTPGGGSRWELFPELRHSGRRHSLAWEERNWNLRLVGAHVAEYVAVRKVGRSGHITLYDHGRYVGPQYEGQYVHVQYDPDRHQWLISDEHGRELRRHIAPEISQEEIVKLTFRKKRKVK